MWVPVVALPWIREIGRGVDTEVGRARVRNTRRTPESERSPLSLSPILTHG
jgi:hypothetical protein